MVDRRLEQEGSPSDEISVFLVDDHAVVRQGLRRILANETGFEVVGDAASASQGLRRILSTRPDLALVDVRLDDGDGIDVVRQVRSRAPGTRCLILTSFDDETAFFQSVVAGAAGYLLKDVEADDLVDACRRVAEGETLLNRETLDDLCRRATELPLDDDFLADLTPRERRILELLTNGLTNKEIADDLDLAEKTVRNYVSTVLSKLSMKNRTEAAAYVARRVARRTQGGT